LLVVDTNVLIYAADRDSEFNQPCAAFLSGRESDPAPTYLTWGICYEFLRVVTHPKVFRTPWTTASAWHFLDYLFGLDAFSILRPTERHADVLAHTIGELSDVRGNLVHDLHTAVLMREHGISRICTRDTDFQRFPFLSIIDPLRT
jgi:toxin-antitoxin system PIN domain toxin